MREMNSSDVSRPVSADIIIKEELGHFNNVGSDNYMGFSKVEEISKDVLSALLTNRDNSSTPDKDLCARAVYIAHTLIDAINDFDIYAYRDGDI